MNSGDESGGSEGGGEYDDAGRDAIDDRRSGGREYDVEPIGGSDGNGDGDDLDSAPYAGGRARKVPTYTTRSWFSG